eukprot:6203914-Pleurochrysis_carterae.AAC.1
MHRASNQVSKTYCPTRRFVCKQHTYDTQHVHDLTGECPCRRRSRQSCLCQSNARAREGVLWTAAEVLVDDKCLELPGAAWCDYKQCGLRAWVRK